MNLIDICIITIVVSLIMRIKAKFEIYKEISDIGYKFNIEKFEQLKKDENSQIDIIIRVLDDYYMYIPFYNLLIDMIRETNYYNNKDAQIDILKRYGAIEKMTEEENKEYKEYKTAYHAIKMEKNHLKKLSYASLAEFPNGSKIWFDFKEDIDERDSFEDIIEVVEVSGIYKNLTIEEQKQKVYHSLLIMGDTIINEEKNNKTKEENKVAEDHQNIPLSNETQTQSKPKTRVRKK